MDALCGALQKAFEAVFDAKRVELEMFEVNEFVVDNEKHIAARQLRGAEVSADFIDSKLATIARRFRIRRL